MGKLENAIDKVTKQLANARKALTLAIALFNKTGSERDKRAMNSASQQVQELEWRLDELIDQHSKGE